MTVREIMAIWLQEHGYDGLCAYECGCKVDDLMPCTDGGQECEPGHITACDCDSEWGYDGERYHIRTGDVVSPEHPAMASVAAMPVIDLPHEDDPCWVPIDGWEGV